MIEQNLNSLFANLLQSTPQLAGIVFYRITNTSSRNAVIESLIEQRHGSKYEAYLNGIPNTPNRKGLFSLIRQLDQRRNEIVHWHTLHDVVMDAGKTTSTLYLTKPNAWSFPTEVQKITVEDMQAFCEKATFTAKSIAHFDLTAAGWITDETALRDAWIEICQQPCIYPPPDTHPLSPNYKAP